MRTLWFLILVGCGTVPSRGQSLEDAFERVQNAVVTIRVTEVGLSPRFPGQVTSVVGQGSGVLISADGKILTAAHVVQTADTISVEFPDGSRRTAEVVASEPLADVALLQLTRLPPFDARVAPLGDSDQARVGSRVFVVGAPLGISHTLTVGHLSARRMAPTSLQGRLRPEFFQTDAAINKGNSGGPLFNMDGEVIGIVSAIVSQSGGSEGLGFAVTSNVARKLLLESPRFWTGLDVILLPPDIAGALNVPNGGSGLLVQRVARNSPAEIIGIKAGTLVATIKGQQVLLGGDIVLSVQGIPVLPESYDDISERLTEVRPGDEVTVVVLRSGNLVELKAKLER